MSDISSVSSLSNLSRDLYYQYMIDHNSMSTMFHALSGDDSDSSGTSGLMNAVSSGLTSSLSGVQGLESLSGLLGGSDSSDSLLGGFAEHFRLCRNFRDISECTAIRGGSDGAVHVGGFKGSGENGGHIQPDLSDRTGYLSVFSGADEETVFFIIYKNHRHALRIAKR